MSTMTTALQSALPDCSAAADGHVLASRGMRFSAAGLDGVIGMLIFVPMLFSMTAAVARFVILHDPFVWTRTMLMSFQLTGLLLIAWCVVTLILVARNGQTIGKKMLGIRVVRSDGSKASLGRIFWLRNVVNMVPSMVPFAGMAYTLLDLLWIFGERHQCLHDLIADTIVVRD